MKELFIVRHAIAEDYTEFSSKGLQDSLRPLTDHGRHKMALVADWLKNNVPEDLDLIAQSPLLRSQQTCEIIIKKLKTKHLNLKETVTLTELTPSVDPEDLYKKLVSLNKDKVMIVGHEPQLTFLIQWLLCADVHRKSPFKLKKGGVVFIEFNPYAELQWYVSPKIITSTNLRSKV